MNKNRTLAALSCLLVAAGLLTAQAPAQAAGNVLVVDAAQTIKPVTRVAAGGLYALATDTNPSVSLLTPLRLKQHTQPAPGVQQLGNGATVPTGDILKVAPSFIANGAQSYARMPDVYPDFPYRWVSWEDWTAKVDKMVRDRLAATSTTNINGWELWNEPDGTWDTAKAGPFFDGWNRTYRQVRSLDNITPIIGPSYSQYYPDLMRQFMSQAKANNTLPDIVVWHELDDFEWRDVDEHVADYRAIERELGISPRKISINEYGSPSQVDTPSAAAHWIAQFERTGVNDAERAYWFESGTVGGLVWNNRPTGSYWLYKWYGEMAGNMVNVTPSGDLDGFASFDSTRKIVNVAFGGTYGDNTVRVTGLGSFGANARVSINYTPESGRQANVDSPTAVSTTTVPIVNGAVDVPIRAQDYRGAYQLVVTPEAGPTTPYQQVYEAENATVVNAEVLPSGAASNGSYVGRIDGSANARNQSFVDFVVEVPTAGAYSLSVRYANGTGANATQGLAYNGGAWSMISYAPTAGWAQFASTPSRSVTLKAGFNVIRLAKGAPAFAGGTGFAELDSITLTR